MDAAGVDVRVISTRAPSVQNLSATDAVPLAKAANDRLAAAVGEYPDASRRRPWGGAGVVCSR
ncbi:MAG TPA: hypothetical protein VFX16_29795 [Pseudonocardiaceae bacterium]|nr:hypothetical protein [Pseudonocardiaceae bacterium]